MISLIDLLAEVGLDHVGVQPLLDSITNVTQSTRGGCKVTFYTREMSTHDLIDKPRNVGMVLWIPRELCEAAEKKLKGESPA